MMNQEYAVGTELPDLVVTDSDNMPSSLSKQMGERGLLVFVLRGTWCPFCVRQIHRVRRRYPEYQKRGVNSVFVVPEPTSNVYSFALSSPEPLPFGLHADESEEIANLLSVTRPAEDSYRPVGLYMLNKDRRVVWSFVGFEDENYPSQTDILNLIEQFL